MAVDSRQTGKKCRKGATHINSHIAQLGPAHCMVQVVFAEVVLGQIRDIRQLHVWDVVWLQHTDVHFLSSFFPLLEIQIQSTRAVS
jgi:hypothetical protein